jgi:phosphoglycolate phosphatase-like HAD superfamily hydrolase
MAWLFRAADHRAASPPTTISNSPASVNPAPRRLRLPAAGHPRSLAADMVRLVLFDIDGTLIRTRGAGVRAFARAFATEFGIVDGVMRLQFAGRTDSGLVREVFEAQGVPATRENFHRFYDRYVFLLDEQLRECAGAVIPGVWDFLRQLEALTVPPLVGLLTGNIRLGAEIKLRRFGLWEVFRTGGFGDDHEDRNQIAAIARARACRLLRENLRGEQIVVVGDTPHDIRCGQAIGARVLAVATGGSAIGELGPHRPEWLVEDLACVSARQVCGV